MEKKNSEYDLGNKKTSFLLLGIAAGCMLGIMAMEYNSIKYGDLNLKINKKANTAELLENINLEVTPPPPPPPPPPVAPPPPQIVIEDIKVTKDETKQSDVVIETEAQLPPPIVVVKPVEKAFTEEEIVDIPDVDASFVGGELAMHKYIQANLNYPKMAQETGTQGKVYVRFVVEKDGAISNVKVIRGVDESLDEEAIKVIKSMSKKWTAGQNKGVNVRSYFTLPITFKLE